MYAYCSNNPILRIDPIGESLEIVVIIAIAIIMIATLNSCSRPEPTSDVGAAKPYVEMVGSFDPSSTNCYGYAVGIDYNLQPGMISGIRPSDYSDVYDVGKSFESDMKKLGRTVRVLSGPNDKIYDNEYKVALRVGTKPYNFNGDYDYHFMRQTNTGAWAEKHGHGGNSHLWEVGLTPDTIPWTVDGITPYYDSDIIYYAIGE